jgi:hypothetical protein
MSVLLVCLCLQLCDLATTLLFIRHGIGEANPLVAALIRISAQPAVVLVLIKAVGCGLAVYAWRSRRMRFLRQANFSSPLSAGTCWPLRAPEVRP